MKLQCLYYALDKWNECGGYIQFRKSTHWCMPHVLHFDPTNGRLTHYVPPDKLKYPWKSMFGFEGFIHTVDEQYAPPMPALCMLAGSLALMIFGFIWLVTRQAVRENRRHHERRTHQRHNMHDRRRTTR